MRQHGAALEVEHGLMVIGADAFFRLGPAQFGMPGLIAIESVGPFVEIGRLGPFITIHDSFIEPGLGIGHHPHRSNERLFYIVRGQIEHDDALNGIRGTMFEGELARLTEGERGMLHREWNGRNDITTHAFILVYTPDVEPPIPAASFAAHRSADVPVDESPGVRTRQLIGGASSFRANSSAITWFDDSTLDPDAELAFDVPVGEATILYPLDGSVTLETDAGRQPLRGTSQAHPEGPNETAVVFAADAPRPLRVRAGEVGARILRIGFRVSGGDDVVRHSPWRAR